MIEAERVFESRQELADRLAEDVAEELRRVIAAKGKATLAVSGGATPRLFFEKLSQADLPWSRVTITLVDERQVPEESERSNARMVREVLLQNNAATAIFSPLFKNPDAEKTAPFDIVILGMGSDGHTASFFPHGSTLAKALDPHSGERLIELKAPGAGEARLTFTLPALLAAGRLSLHIEGAEKRSVLGEALAEGPAEDMPVRAVLRAKTPVTLYWCP